eukprot:Platyproteum_vivax@DN10578_c0_g1_i1.p1
MTGTNAFKPLPVADRFIPIRSSGSLDASSMKLTHSETQWEPENKFDGILAANMLGVENVEDQRILALKTKAPKPDHAKQSEMNVVYSYNSLELKKAKTNRVMPSEPYRILDAPGFENDYYNNTLDWSCHNMVAIALDSELHLWNATSGDTTNLNLDSEAHICSVKFDQTGSHVSVGLGDGSVEIWNVVKQKKLRVLRSHQSKVSALAWAGAILTTGGGKDTEIHNNDVRKPEPVIGKLKGHQGAICGLAWNSDHTLLASGGNDNMLNIWSLNNWDCQKPKYSLNDHCAAVRAVAWCPWQNNLLASGGGTSDRAIRFWNSSSGKLLDVIKTDSQICSLQWGQHDREIVSTHGYSRNHICVWKYPSLVCLGELTGHQERVLASAVSPDGTVLLSASPDETLRFWKLWSIKKTAPATVSAQNSAIDSKQKPIARLR